MKKGESPFSFQLLQAPNNWVVCTIYSLSKNFL